MKDFLKDFTGNILSKEQMKGVLGGQANCGYCLSGSGNSCSELILTWPVQTIVCLCNEDSSPGGGGCGYLQQN